MLIERGKLVVIPQSGKPIPDGWLPTYGEEVLLGILNLCKCEALRYDNYSTGQYGSGKYEGITLQFTSLPSSASRYTNFNVNIRRQKDSKYGKRGDLLPKGRFSAGKQRKFVEFWLRCDFEIPHGRSCSYHDYMGNLKRIIFTGEIDKGERLKKGSIQPLNLSYEEIFETFEKRFQTCKSQTSHVYLPDNGHTSPPYKQQVECKEYRGSQSDLTTGNISYGNKGQGNQGGKKNVIPFTKTKRPEDQSIEEWRRHYSTPNSEKEIP